MNPKVKALWLTALRSGEYRQITGALHVPGVGFCCLGVLCDLHRKATGKGRWENRNALGSIYCVNLGDESKVILPKEVANWAGLSECSPRLGSSSKYGVSILAKLNDLRVPFSEIANLIEKEP